MKTLNNIFATWFFLGYIPKAPGTWGSLGGLAFVYLLSINWTHYTGNAIDLLQYGCFTLGLLLLGILSATRFDTDHATHDSKMIVVDEVVGMMITCLPMIWLAATHDAFLAFGGWVQPLLAFGLFRFFDILKPWPISLIDQKVTGGLGVMLDDVLAGFFAAVVFIGIGYAFHELT